MGFSEKDKVAGIASSEEGTIWVIAGIELRSPLKLITSKLSSEKNCCIQQQQQQPQQQEEEEEVTTPKAKTPAERLLCPPPPKKPRPSLRFCHLHDHVQFFTPPPEFESVFSHLAAEN